MVAVLEEHPVSRGGDLVVMGAGGGGGDLGTPVAMLVAEDYYIIIIRLDHFAAVVHREGDVPWPFSCVPTSKLPDRATDCW